MLIDKDDTNNLFDIDGNIILLFNDKTTATFYETYESVKITRFASKCYFIERTHSWHQFIYKDKFVYQYSCNGIFIRRIEQVQRLSDYQIRTLINVDVRAKTPLTVTNLNSLYDKWENDLFMTLENSDTTVDNIKRIIYNTEYL